MAGNSGPVRASGRKGIPLFALFLLFYIPLIPVFYRFFSELSGREWGMALMKVLQSASLQRSLKFTLIQAVLSALLSILFALPGAALFSRYRFPFKKALLSLSSVSFILPPILVVLAFVQFWGKQGWVNQIWQFIRPEAEPIRVLYSAKAILMAHVFYNLPLALRFIYDGWSTIPQNQNEAAASLGASPRAAFMRIILPQLMRSVLSAFLIIFLYCFLSFSIILVLGGGPRYSTLEVEIYQQIKFSGNYVSGGITALIELSISLMVLLCYFYFENRGKRMDHPEMELGDNRELNRPGKILLLFYSVLYLLFLAAPMMALISQSFIYRKGWGAEAQFSLHWYQSLFRGQGQSGSRSLLAIANSLRYALASTGLILLISTAIAHWSLKKRLALPRFTQILVLLPMGISSVILALGYLTLSVKLPYESPVKSLLIILIHLFISLPFAYRSVSNRIGQIPPSLIMAAENLGASPLRTLIHIEWPVLKQALFTGAIFAFALSMGEVNAVLILSGPEQSTIPLEIYRMIGHYNFNGASAMGSLLILITLAAFWLLEKSKHEH